MMYDSLAPELITARFRARRLIHTYNAHFPPDATPASLTADRAAILSEIFGKVGANPFVEPPLRVDYGCNVSIGKDFYANFGLVILDCGIVRIGERVMFGPGVAIFTATHKVGVQSRREGREYAVGVDIGDDCWVGGNVTIMPGVRIGECMRAYWDSCVWGRNLDRDVVVNLKGIWALTLMRCREGVYYWGGECGY